MRFVPTDELAEPNIVVDGAAQAETVLTLSHWPKSMTPAELKADVSTEIHRPPDGRTIHRRASAPPLGALRGCLADGQPSLGRARLHRRAPGGRWRVRAWQINGSREAT